MNPKGGEMLRTKLMFSCFDGTVRYYETSTETREAVSFYPSNRMQSRYLVKDGRFHGICTSWFRNGNKKSEEPYFEGRLNGVVRTWHENGLLESQYIFRTGTFRGIGRKWDIQGNLVLVKLNVASSFDAPQLLSYLEGLLLKGTLSAKDIVQVNNVELRRILIEDMGYEKFAQQVNSKIIDQDNERALLRIDFPPDEPLYLVTVRCPSTRAFYMLRVPPTMTTVQEAVAWTFGLKADKYAPEVET